MSGTLILFSKRPQDSRFFGAVSRALAARFVRVGDAESLCRALGGSYSPLVIWDADATGERGPAEQDPVEAVRLGVAGLISPSRVFALTDKTVNNYPELFKRGLGGEVLFLS
jgi:hypothetical protein